MLAGTEMFRLFQEVFLSFQEGTEDNSVFIRWRPEKVFPFANVTQPNFALHRAIQRPVNHSYVRSHCEKFYSTDTAPMSANI